MLHIKVSRYKSCLPDRCRVICVICLHILLQATKRHSKFNSELITASTGNAPLIIYIPLGVFQHWRSSWETVTKFYKTDTKKKKSLYKAIYWRTCLVPIFIELIVVHDWETHLTSISRIPLITREHQSPAY